MKSDDAAERVEWDVQELKRSIEEWEEIAARILEGLHETVAAQGLEHWRPHFAQLVRVVRRFQERCRAESQRFGLWREDELQPNEVYEMVWDEAEALVQWLTRMMAQ